MPLKVGEQFEFGGVDSRSNPGNFPRNRALRCLNWEPQLNGRLQLRRGFTTPTNNNGNNASIHSAFYYELLAGNPQYILFGQGNQINRYRLSDGTVTNIGAMTGSNPWGQYRANGRIFFNDGVTGLQSYDGATLRPVGIRAPTTGEVSGIVVNATTAGGGTFSTTLQGGYIFYLAYQNPNTGHVGNRTQINATAVPVPGAGYAFVFTGLPNLAGVNAEWVKVIGRTPDGTQVPYWMTDANQNNIIVGNAATTATYTSPNVNFNEELPTRNTVPPANLAMFCKLLGRVFGASGTDLFVYYTEAEEDVVSGIFVGRPEESWPGDNAEAYPSGEPPSCLAAYNNLGWFFSRKHLYQWSESLRQSVSDPWIGPWPVGCAGKRAFVETKYGAFWVSGTKRLMTFGPLGPVPVSGEYERALLAKISNTNLALTEIAYYEDVDNEIDRLEIFGLDSNNNPVIVVHDFNLKKEENFYLAPGEGQGYSRAYVGMTMSTFVRETESIASVRDTSNKLRLWCGDSVGKFRQLEDGNSDNGSEYSADYIGLFNTGTHDKRFVEVNFYGDKNVIWSWYMGADLDAAFTKFNVEETESMNRDEANLYSSKIGSQGSFLYYRFQLTSHHVDGNFDLTDPPQVPMNVYGQILGVKLKEGADRPDSRK